MKHTLTYTIIKINVVVFLLDQFIPVASALIRQLGMFNVESLVGGQVWRLLTFQFIHGSSQNFSGALLHLAFNMIGLYYFGPTIERYWGRVRFLAFYLICGVAGVAGYMLLGKLFGFYSFTGTLVGASAGLFGVFVATVMVNPHQLVSLIFLPTKAFPIKYVAWAAIGYSISNIIAYRLGFSGFLGIGGNTGGEAAHLGGALMGYLFMRYPTLLNWVPFAVPVTPQINGRQSDQGFYSSERFRGKSIYEAKLKPKADIPEPSVDQQELNRILDKVHQQGIHHLTAEEQLFLKRYYEEKR